MVALASILVLGIASQWLAWRLRLPSILVLLLVGFAVGPFTGFLAPDDLLGESLLPFVSLAVAAILLEGGLSLRLRDLRGVGGAVRNLVLIGSPVTWGLATAAAYWILDLDLGPSLLLGGILIVTGPTVIIPLLRHVRPAGAVGSVVRWEGIVTDPIGALVAVLVFQAILPVSEGSGSSTVVDLVTALVASGVAGAAGAGLVLLLLHRNWIPDFLHSTATLSIGMAAFVASNELQHESGLLAVTWMGVLLANQRRVSVEHIVEFKENLRVLLISSLFILLAARLPLEEFTRFDLRILAFVGALVLVVRPVSVFASTLGTSLSWAERAFVAWMAPRGIVAAAVASVFALELGEAGVPDADRLTSIVFSVIVLTVAVYGLTAGPLARRLGLSTKGPPQGVLIVGAHVSARRFALALSGADIPVLLVDTNHHDVQAARIEGLEAHYGSVLSEDFENEAPLYAVGHLLALTQNDEINALACLHFTPALGRANVHQLAPEGAADEEAIPRHLRGNVLLGGRVSFWDLEARFRAGAVVKRTRLGEEFPYEDFLGRYGGTERVVLLGTLSEDGRLRLATKADDFQPSVGDTVLAVVDPIDEDAEG